MGLKKSILGRVRLSSPWAQNFLMGTIIGLTAGLYQALNLLGAGGGRPNSAQTVQASNATLCAVWFVSSLFAGSVLNTIGPALTAIIGVFGFMVYVAGLWFFDQVGQEWFPILGGVAIGATAGLIWVVMGSICMSYSEEDERGSFIAISVNLQAVGAAIGGLIPLIINRNSQEVAGVPVAVYIIILCMMGVACLIATGLRPPWKVIRGDGTQVATIRSRGFLEELKANVEVFKDWRLVLMIPAFLPSETFLVYGGSVNAYGNDLRTRCLLSFCAVCFQIPCGYGLQKILDHTAWSRRKRAFVSLATVSTPLMASWIWEIIRVRNYDRANPPAQPLDWSEPRFGPTFVLFVMRWVSSVLFQYLILYFLSCMSNDPRKTAVYSGVYRSFLAAGEAICFGIDSIAIPYINEAGIIFAFYAAGVLIYIYLAAFQVTQTQYFTGEEGVVIPKHVVEERAEDVEANSDKLGDQDGQVVQHQNDKGLLAAQIGSRPGSFEQVHDKIGRSREVVVK